MTGFKRSKQSRARGSWTHGWGSKKKHRGAGNRGGRGKAGSGKKGDAKKPMFWAEKDFYQKNKGFSSKSRTKITTVNVGELCKNVDYFVTNEMAKQTGDTFIMNLSDLGCDKLLGSGRVDKKLQITVSTITERAKAKIEKAGGSVVVAEAAKEKPKAKPQEKPPAKE